MNNQTDTGNSTAGEDLDHIDDDDKQHDATGDEADDAQEPPPPLANAAAEVPIGPARWLRRLVLASTVVTLIAVGAIGYAAVRRHTIESDATRQAAAVTAARQWVELFTTTTEETVVARAADIASRTADPLSDEPTDRIEPFLEQLSDDGTGHQLQITSAAVERGGERDERPPAPDGATTVLVTTTARSGTLGHGFALWLYVVERDGSWKIADFGGAG